MKSLAFGILIAATAAILLGFSSCEKSTENQSSLLNVSYDPTREFFQEYNAAFAKHWDVLTGRKNSDLAIFQSHGGSGKQARSVIEGLEADVVTLALSYDIDAIAASRDELISRQWRNNFPNNSSPYSSTVVFLVRKGNPKGIHEWPDLIKQDVKVIAPNPKTSGGARWNYLAAWSYAFNETFEKSNKSPDARQQAEGEAKKFVTKLYHNVPVLDSGARGSTTTFVQRHLGDVLITWENEAFLVLKEFGQSEVEIVTPSMSILANPPVAIVDKVVDKKGTRRIAQEYLAYLYSQEGQSIAAKNFFRPIFPELVPPEDLKPFPKIRLLRLEDVLGDWTKVQQAHFGDGGIFDQIYQPAN